MPIELIFNARDVDELHAQITAYATGLYRPSAPAEEAPETPEPEPELQWLNDLPPAVKAGTPPDKKASKPAKKAAKKPEPEPEPEDEPEEPAPLADALRDAVANEKLKADVIATLQDLFTAGKVKVIRSVLDRYGDGAKSFPEIDAAKFPLIKEALEKGEIA